MRNFDACSDAGEHAFLADQMGIELISAWIAGIGRPSLSASRQRLGKHRTAAVSRRAKTAIWRRSGVASSGTSPSMALIRPISG